MNSRSQLRSREVAPGRREAGVDEHRLAVVRRRAADELGEVEVRAVEVDALLLAPDRAHDVEPLLAVDVALVVLALLLAEHLELVLVPAADEVQPEAARARCGRSSPAAWRRRSGGSSARGSCRRPCTSSCWRAGRSPGQRLERRALEVGWAAVPAPAPDRKEELEPRPSASCATSRLFSHVGSQRSGTVVIAQAPGSSGEEPQLHQRRRLNIAFARPAFFPSLLSSSCRSLASPACPPRTQRSCLSVRSWRRDI